MASRDWWAGVDRAEMGRHRRVRRTSAVEILEARIAPAVFTVTTAADNGDNTAPTAGSLREAILLSNASGDSSNVIDFNIPGNGVQTINIETVQLPSITKTVLVDGLSQPGSSFQSPLIQLSCLSFIGNGLTLSGVSGSVIRGLSIARFQDAGVVISGGSNNWIQACQIGVFADWSQGYSNGNGVIIKDGATGNIIGTNGDGVADAAEGNLISGNSREGVLIADSGTSGNRVAGNRIGTNLQETSAIPNLNGVGIKGGAAGNIVGTNGDGVADADEGNLISGNTDSGVSITGAGTSGNRVAGNRIGTNALGTAAISNGIGVAIEDVAAGNIVGTNGDGVADADEGNLISGNYYGLYIAEGATGNRVAGNRIGTNALGTAAISNVEGVLIVSGATGNIVGTNGDGIADAQEGNLISGNTGSAVSMGWAGTSGNRVAGNKIGVDWLGMTAIPNDVGVSIENVASGNIIGTNGDGIADAGEGNIISGNRIAIFIAGPGADGNRVAGNKIGVNATATASVPNKYGVYISGYSTGNIVGMNGDGLADSDEGNYIAGNVKYGVVIGGKAADNRVAGNIISYNGVGIAIGFVPQDNSIGNLITRNSIYKNKVLGIDLGDDGVTANGPNATHSGANQLLNFPVFTTANLHGSDLVLEGAAPTSSTIEVFIADPHPTGYGEGRTYLASLVEGSALDQDPTPGYFRFVIPIAAFPALVTAQTFLTATATLGVNGDPAASERNTSEFSKVVQVTRMATDLGLTSTVDAARPDVGDVVVFTISLTNNGPDAATGVRVSALLPAGLAFVSASPSQGAYNPTNGAWIVGGVGAGQTLILKVSARVDAPRPTSSVAWIYASDQDDLKAGDNAVTTSLTPRFTDLAVTQTSDRSSLVVGETVALTIQLHNAGPDDAGSVTLKDVLPAGLSFVSAAASQGSYDPTTGTWNVGPVPSGSTLQLVVTALATAAGDATSTAVVAGSDRFDTNPSNSSASTSVEVVLPTPVAVDSLVRHGYRRQSTTLDVGFSGPLGPATAQDVSNYTLARIGPGGRLGRSLPLASALYDDAANRVTLVPRVRRLPLQARYLLIVHSGGVVDRYGRPIDGDGDGVSGGDYVRVFGPGILTRPQRPTPVPRVTPTRVSHPGAAPLGATVRALPRTSMWSRTMR
ncbi:DUF11 domain-containing protein [Paludisphaera rhizosphaerae]|uniref:DUF11 domain-containing protein n=1 Tax=Paludisphaera rhizosphaerae TaxID=2711216 RepID=UPI0013EAFECC|nr:DUF11 domain-containing protein [Paludisphaera rhizosphaerae]